jgi:ubiquinol oxidase
MSARWSWRTTGGDAACAAPPADPATYPDAYHVSWLLFLVAPEWSYRLNADFEDHAEHEYIGYVAGHPQLEAQPDPGSYAAEYGRYGCVADLLRQIGHDERIHKLDSLASMGAARFGRGG